MKNFGKVKTPAGYSIRIAPDAVEYLSNACVFVWEVLYLGTILGCFGVYKVDEDVFEFEAVDYSNDIGWDMIDSAQDAFEAIIENQ